MSVLKCLLTAATVVVLGQAQTSVTLSPVASPSAGQAGVSNINVTGSGFPSGTINAANTTVTLRLPAGGSPVSVQAASVMTMVGSHAAS